MHIYLWRYIHIASVDHSESGRASAVAPPVININVARAHVALIFPQIAARARGKKRDGRGKIGSSSGSSKTTREKRAL